MQMCFKKYLTRNEKFLERSQTTEKHEVRARSWILLLSAHLLRWITVIGCLRDDLTNYQRLVRFCRKRSRGCGRAGRSPGRMCHSLFRGRPLALNASVFLPEPLLVNGMCLNFTCTIIDPSVGIKMPRKYRVSASAVSGSGHSTAPLWL